MRLEDGAAEQLRLVAHRVACGVGSHRGFENGSPTMVLADPESRHTLQIHDGMPARD